MDDKKSKSTEAVSLDIAIDIPKEYSTKYVQSKYEYDLYKDEDNIVQPIYRVKRISLPNKGERWKVFQDTDILFVIDGIKISKKEKAFLRTLDGVSVVMTAARQGARSFSGFRKVLKDYLAANKQSDQH